MGTLDQSDLACDSTTEQQGGKKSKRIAFSFSKAVERFIDDALEGRFPIKFRLRDCERLNIIPTQLNSLHKKGDQEGVKQYICGLVRVVMSEEEVENI